MEVKEFKAELFQKAEQIRRYMYMYSVHCNKRKSIYTSKVYTFVNLFTSVWRVLVSN